ncbi:thiamine pyrophosphate-binding protein [Pseudobutyrivibrio sp.]
MPQMFVFPYSKVSKGSRIILYGAGHVGNAFFEQLKSNCYAKVVKWVDRRFLEGVDVDYSDIDFDYVVIAIESQTVADEIRTFLMSKGIREESIIWENPLVKYSVIEAKDNKEDTIVDKIHGYSVEKNVQYLLALLKKRGIRKIVISPGATNICLVRSMQNDSFFELYSSADERSAAYIAVGMASHTGEPVVLSCTGATASRNYIPGLTEAYYRKLPILAVTSSQYFGRAYNNIAQMIDRSILPRDISVYQARIPMVRCNEDDWYCKLEINKALIALKRRGGGPVHIDLETDYSTDFGVEVLPDVTAIDCIEYDDVFPAVTAQNVAVIIGSHKPFSCEEEQKIDAFCEKYNALVLSDLIGNYHGKYKVNPALISSQQHKNEILDSIDLLIYLGNTTGYSYISINPKEVWRVNVDGEVRDLFKKTTKVFAVSERCFFDRYISMANSERDSSYYEKWLELDNNFRGIMRELPFSNPWIASHALKLIPKTSVLHLAILNTLRAWNLEDTDTDFAVFSNTGGFGIDGCMSTFIGAAMADYTDRLYFGVIGDLSFFYDMNVLGNRHIRNNVRLILINNGMGAEFKNYGHMGKAFGDDTDSYIAAAGHYGNKSKSLVKHYAEDLGFEYVSVESKEDFARYKERFFSIKEQNRPLLMEVFTDYQDESMAIEILYNLGEGL